jgi:formate C-acetyltransferase
MGQAATFFRDERKKGVLAVDAHTPSTMLAHGAGYIDRDNEVIVGLQTDQPLSGLSFRLAACGWSKPG